MVTLERMLTAAVALSESPLVRVVVAVIVLWLLAVAWAKHLRSRLERDLHVPDDPDCRFWTGDKCGTNLSAICPVCGTKP